MERKREQLTPILAKSRNSKKKSTPEFNDILHVNPIVNRRNEHRIIKGHPVIQVSEKKSQSSYENIKHEHHQRLNRAEKLKRNEEISSIIQNYYEETSQFNNSADTSQSNMKSEFLNHLKEANKQIDQAAVQLKQISNLLSTKRSKNTQSKTKIAASNQKSDTKLVTGVTKPRKEEPSKVLHSCFKKLESDFDYSKYLKNIHSDAKIIASKTLSSKHKRDKHLVNTLDIVNAKLMQVKSKYFEDTHKSSSNIKAPSKKYYSLKNISQKKLSATTIQNYGEEDHNKGAQLLYKNSDYSDTKTLNCSEVKVSEPKTSMDFLNEDVDKIIEKYYGNVKRNQLRDVPEPSNQPCTSVALDTSDSWESAVGKSKYLSKEFDMLTEDYSKMKIQQNWENNVVNREEFRAIRTKLLSDLDYNKPD